MPSAWAISVSSPFLLALSEPLNGVDDILGMQCGVSLTDFEVEVASATTS